VTTGFGVVLNNARLRIGESVAVYGAGGIGLNVVQAAALVSAYPVIAVDLHDAKLRLALELGATHVINASREDAVKAIRTIAGTRGIDCFIDNTGLPAVIDKGHELTAPQGRVVLVGAPKHGSEIEVPAHGGGSDSAGRHPALSKPVPSRPFEIERAHHRSVSSRGDQHCTRQDARRTHRRTLSARNQSAIIALTAWRSTLSHFASAEEDMLEREAGLFPDRDLLISLVREAGAAILDLYRNQAGFETKADGSPVTAADLRSHRILSAGLARLSTAPVLSEEHLVGYQQRAKWQRLWLVDPLDGTKDYLAHNDEFTINVALIDSARPALGIVYAPALDELYYAERETGAFQVRGSDWQRLPAPHPWRTLRMATSRFHDVAAAQEFARVNGIVESQAIGSALKFARLARGDLSIYPRFTGSSEWDIAAGHCVLEAVGCRIIDLESGAPPLYNKPDLTNHHFIALAPTIDFAGVRLPSNTN
jgi:3'(2'), 5'-bisphosphate nucleotidase